MTATATSDAPRAPEPRRRRKRPRWALFAAAGVGVVIIVLIVVLAVSKQSGDSADSNLIGEPAPGISGRLLNVDTGKVGTQEFRLSGAPGKWVLVNFFASWCVPCQDEAPELKKWAEAHETAGDAELVQVVYGKDDPRDSAELLRDNGGASWPVVVGDSGTLGLDWGVAKVPETFLVAPDGTIVLKTIAPVTQAWLDKQIGEFEQGS